MTPLPLPDRLDRLSILATSVVSRMFSQGDQMTVSARFCCAIVGSTTTACRGQIYKNVFHVQKKHLYVQSRNKWVLRNSFFLPLKNGQTKYHKCISTLWQFYRVLRPLRLIYRTESSITSALYASVSHLVCAWIWSCRCVCCVHVQHQRQWYIFSTTYLPRWWWSGVIKKETNENTNCRREILPCLPEWMLMLSSVLS